MTYDDFVLAIMKLGLTRDDAIMWADRLRDIHLELTYKQIYCWYKGYLHIIARRIKGEIR